MSWHDQLTNSDVVEDCAYLHQLSQQLPHCNSMVTSKFLLKEMRFRLDAAYENLNSCIDRQRQELRSRERWKQG